MSKIAAVDEVTDAELKQEIEQLTAARYELTTDRCVTVIISYTCLTHSFPAQSAYTVWAAVPLLSVTVHVDVRYSISWQPVIPCIYNNIIIWQ